MIDRFAISAELRRRGSNFAVIARRVGVTPRLVSYVAAGERRNREVRHELARAIGKTVREIWPEQRAA